MSGRAGHTVNTLWSICQEIQCRIVETEVRANKEREKKNNEVEQHQEKKEKRTKLLFHARPTERTKFGELNPKIKFVLFERTLKITSFRLQFLIPLFRFWDISVSLICKLHIWRSIRAMTYWKMLYIFAIIKPNHFEVIMCVYFSHDTKHVHFEVISFYNSIIKIYNILRYVIPRILRHMCNLHIKETERSKRIKNWKITYSVILSVLSNKTNLILGFSSPLSVFSI